MSTAGPCAGRVVGATDYRICLLGYEQAGGASTLENSEAPASVTMPHRAVERLRSQVVLNPCPEVRAPGTNQLGDTVVSAFPQIMVGEYPPFRWPDWTIVGYPTRPLAAEECSRPTVQGQDDPWNVLKYPLFQVIPIGSVCTGIIASAIADLERGQKRQDSTQAIVSEKIRRMKLPIASKTKQPAEDC